MVGLSGLGGRYPHELSGGQQQRVALARALAIRPALVLLDEPFSSLDAGLRASVRSDVQDVLRSGGTTVVLVTHDQDEALSVADQVAVIRGGTIGQCGTPQELYDHPVDPAMARFLGDANLVAATVEGDRVLTPFGPLELRVEPNTSRLGRAGGGAGPAGAAGDLHRGERRRVAGQRGPDPVPRPRHRDHRPSARCTGGAGHHRAGRRGPGRSRRDRSGDHRRRVRGDLAGRGG